MRMIILIQVSHICRLSLLGKKDLSCVDHLFPFVYYLISEEPGQRSPYNDWLRAERRSGLSSSSCRFKNFYFLHVVQTGSGDHPASYTMGTGGSSSRIKRPGPEADHWSPTTAEVKKNI
jgi:hypothetical protein